MVDSIPTSTNPTAPRVVKYAPRIDQGRTHCNTQGTVPPSSPTMVPPSLDTPLTLFTEGDNTIDYDIPTHEAPTGLPPLNRPYTYQPPIISTYCPLTMIPSTKPFTSLMRQRSRRCKKNLQTNIITQESINVNFILYQVYSEDFTPYKPDVFAFT